MAVFVEAFGALSLTISVSETGTIYMSMPRAPAT